jgi:hypothetical protein
MRGIVTTSLVLMAIGLLAAYLQPGHITAALLPVGLIIWWLAVRIIKIGEPRR